MRKLAKQFLRFSGVGIPAFFIDYFLLMLFSQVFGWHPAPAGALSFIISTIFNYVASMKFVYTHRDDLSRRREFVVFVALSAAGLVLNVLIIWLGAALVGTRALEVTLTKLVSGIIVSLWNFFSRRHWLDADQRQSDPRPQ